MDQTCSRQAGKPGETFGDHQQAEMGLAFRTGAGMAGVAGGIVDQFESLWREPLAQPLEHLFGSGHFSDIGSGEGIAKGRRCRSPAGRKRAPQIHLFANRARGSTYAR